MMIIQFQEVDDVAKQTIHGGVYGELSPVKTCQSPTLGADPEITVFILKHYIDLRLRQTINGSIAANGVTLLAHGGLYPNKKKPDNQERAHNSITKIGYNVYNRNTPIHGITRIKPCCLIKLNTLASNRGG